jgi:hypothetical protein
MVWARDAHGGFLEHRRCVSGRLQDAGAKWNPGGAMGDDAVQAARHIGLDCQEWQAWEGGEGFEVCSDVGHPIEL